MPHHGRGYMKRGLGAVLADAFLRHGLHRLEANIEPTTKRLATSFNGLDFGWKGSHLDISKLAGRWRDHERWAITIEEWKAQSRKAGYPSTQVRKSSRG